MIHNFYLLKKSGECVIHRKYGSLETDENLVSGFLSAMFSFGRNISGRNIESVLLDDKKFVYVCSDEVIFAAYTDRDDMIKNKLDELSELFLKEYGNLENWDGDRDKFVEFLPKLDAIFGAAGKEAPENIVNDIFQKIQTGKGSINDSMDELLNYFKDKVKKVNQ
ncbi:MAG: hypothetical protein ACUVXA_06810 [Candidatus Jordarchaeum sp.]|uniref:hypothetical protein n=1 Tax=Candidatus Jordarchaeum sp. TaxID=2823881 RepID=UPI00404985B4